MCPLRRCFAARTSAEEEKKQPDLFRVIYISPTSLATLLSISPSSSSSSVFPLHLKFVLRFAITEDFRPSCGPTGGTKAWGPHVSPPNPRSQAPKLNRRHPIPFGRFEEAPSPADRCRPPLPPPHCTVPARSSLTDRGRPPLLPPLGQVPARRAPAAGRPRAPAAGLRSRRHSAPSP